MICLEGVDKLDVLGQGCITNLGLFVSVKNGFRLESVRGNEYFPKDENFFIVSAIFFALCSIWSVWTDGS